MKKRLQTGSGILEFFVMTLLAMAMILYLNGCAADALKLAKHKASPENVEYWKINRVESAVVQQSGDVQICVELSGREKDATPELKTINLPLPVLSGDASAIEKFGLRPAKPAFNNKIHYWYSYWYPIEKTKNGCKPAARGTPTPITALAVENISVKQKNRDQLYTLLDIRLKNQPFKERIFEVDFASGEKNEEKNDSDILLIYWPAPTLQQDVEPIPITGAYEDNRTYLYYLLVPVAFVGDVIVLTTLLALRMSMETLGH